MQADLSGELPAPNRNGNSVNDANLAESEEFKTWARELNEHTRLQIKAVWDHRPWTGDLKSYQAWARNELEIMCSVSEFGSIVQKTPDFDRVFWALYHGGMEDYLGQFKETFEENEDILPADDLADWICGLPRDHVPALFEIGFAAATASSESAEKFERFIADRLLQVEQYSGYLRLVLRARTMKDVANMIMLLSPRN